LFAWPTPPIADTLTELALFVNDQIEGYKTAADKIIGPENHAYYLELVQQSQQFANEVNDFARAAGGNAESGSSSRGWKKRKGPPKQYVNSAAPCDSLTRSSSASLCRKRLR
jgi:hypothetical protein